MRLNDAVIKNMVIDGNQCSSMKEFINKLKCANGLAMDVYVNTKLIWSGPARLRLDSNWLIAYSSTQISFTESVGVESVVARIRQNDTILFESITAGNTIIPENDTFALFYVGLLSDSPYNCLKKATPDSKFIPKLTNKLHRVVFDEIERTLNDGDIEDDSDVTVWKLSVDPEYTFSHNSLVNWTDPDNPERYVILYNSDHHEVEYDSGMTLAYRRSDSSSWSGDDIDGYTVIANPNSYYSYNDTPGENEPTANDRAYVCAANSSYYNMSGVIIYKINTVGVAVDMINCYIDGVATPILSYENDGVTYYNLATIDAANSVEWVTQDSLSDYNISLEIN